MASHEKGVAFFTGQNQSTPDDRVNAPKVRREHRGLDVSIFDLHMHLRDGEISSLRLKRENSV